MTSSKPKRLRFVVGSALLVSLPLSGCGEEEPPTVNTVYVEPPPNPVGETPTMASAEGRGVPLPEPIRPEPPTNPAMTEPPPPDDEENGGPEGVGEALGEIRANPAPTPRPEPIRANPGPARSEPPE